MAHNIEERDGLFVVRAPAWHGLGTVLPEHPSREEAQKLAHPWEPVSEPVYRKVIRLEEREHEHSSACHSTACSYHGTKVSVPVESFEKIEDARQAVREILRGETCTDIGNTAYGLVQASVEYLGHVRRAHSRESRFKRTYLDRSEIVADAVELAQMVASGG